MSFALVVAAFLAALIAFYSAIVRTAPLVEDDESGIPASDAAHCEVDLRKAA